MAYNKKNWQDNVSDITAAELNKIEQGIYDNSLVVDAVTNTLNPTDTETYKAAELTEGQITDVIGVNDILIKGQTEQDGEPTPSAPVDVNVVSGSNVINTSNKNLLSLPNGTYSYNNVTAIVNTGIITINGTPSSTPTLLRISLTQPIKLKQNDSIKINVNNLNGIGTSSNFVSFRLSGTVNGVSNDNITDIVCTNANANNTFTATNDTTINQVVIRGNTNVTFNNFVIKPQIELGTTITTYEPHQGKELPLDLPVENLLNANFVQGSYNSDAALDRISCRNVQLKANTTYSLSTDLNYNNFNIALGTSTELFPHSSAFIYDSGWKNSNFSFTTGNVDVYCNISIKKTNNSNITPNDVSEVQFQLEQGSKVNAYTPFGTEPIELCKIGDYQDYFYKSGSKWYLHKEINRIKLDGSESISILNTGTVNWYYRVVPSVIKEVNSQTNQICNYYNNVEIFNSNTTQGIMMVLDGAAIRIRYGTEDTVANFKTWLSNNNVILYCQLKNATNTEITNTTLISQLEAIYNAPLYEETNITQTNNDLPMVLDITACKDNINGIKAFIRK